MIDTPLAAEPPFKLSTEQLNTGVLQLYVVFNGTIPFTVLFGLYTKSSPLQIVSILLLIVGLGFTVMITLMNVLKFTRIRLIKLNNPISIN